MSQLPVLINPELTTVERDNQDNTIIGSLWYNSTTSLLEYSLDGLGFNTIILNNGTGATGIWNIDISGNAATSSTVSGGYVSSVIGTLDQVIVSSSQGDVTFSLPQSINTNSDVIFNSLQALELTGANSLTLNDGGKVQVVAPSTNFYLTNDTTGAGNNVRIAATNTVFYKNLFVMPGINTLYTTPYDNEIGQNGAPLGQLWVTLINGFQPYGGVFQQSADGTLLTASTTETEILGTGNGTLTFPANTLSTQSYTFVVSGDLSGNNGDTLTIRLTSNFSTTPIVWGSVIVDLNNATSKFFEIEIDFTIRTIGAAGVASIVSNFDFTYNENAGNSFAGNRATTFNNTTFDTTIANILTITAEFSSADIANSIQSRLGILSCTY